jgi:hypothetical protein
MGPQSGIDVLGVYEGKYFEKRCIKVLHAYIYIGKSS